MGKLLQVESTLTDRYQTTIPEPIRESLHLGKRDKIAYTLQDNGKVLISRANEDDPLISDFLLFLQNDIKNNPSHLHSISASLLTRAQNLVSGIEVDLDGSLDDKDD
jgi:antitoxin PrlF